MSYSRFGPSNPLTPRDIDPVDQCVGNVFFTTSGITGQNMQSDFCPRFMSQRCAVNWDNYCEAYLATSQVDAGGNPKLNKNWLEGVANKKYCRAYVEAPGANCSLKCESFNPQGQTSVDICETVGAQNWMDTKNQEDLGGNFPQSSMLNPLSPIYMDSCPEICDAKNSPVGSLGADDEVLNKCIELGACSSVLMDLAYNSVKNNLDVTNPKFQKIIEYAKLNVPVNPNTIVKIAKAYGVPSNVAVDILKDVKYNGGVTEGYNSDLKVSGGVVSPIITEVVFSGDVVPTPTPAPTVAPTPTPTPSPKSEDEEECKKSYVGYMIFFIVLILFLFVCVMMKK